ncbi:MAG: type I secretion system permease/ATPase [Henriciella sp.]
MPQIHPSDHPIKTALKRSQRTLIGLAAFSFILNLLMLTGPLYMLQVYDRVLSSQSVPTLVALTILILVLFGTVGLVDWVRRSLLSIVAARIEDRLADPVLKAALENSIQDPGQSAQRPLQDLSLVRRFVASPSTAALFDLPWSPLFFAALFMLHWSFGLWALFGCAVLVTMTVLNRTLTKTDIEDAQADGRAAQIRASEFIRYADTARALGMEQALQTRWRSTLDAADTAMRTSESKLAFFTANTKSSRLFLQSAILGLGAWLVILGQSTAGAMIAASILMGRAIAPIEQIVGQWSSFATLQSALKNLSEAVSKTAVRSETMPLPAITGRLQLEGVSAGPPNTDKPVLKNLSFDMAPGDVLGIIGPSAAGKTTLAKVIGGIWRPKLGTVRIDGADIETWTRDALGPQIGYLSQQVDLFGGTVKENISRFNPDAAPDAVIAAAKNANCHDLILSLPAGYDTEIGQSGAYLSAGQRQRVGLARALYGDPNLVILDEPNANLDSPGEEALQNAIIGLKARKATIIIIAHRPNAIQHCQRLLVLKDGEIKLLGPRDEVLSQLSSTQAKTGVTPIRSGGGGHG